MPGSCGSHVYCYEAVGLQKQNTFLIPSSIHTYCCDVVGPKEPHQLLVNHVSNTPLYTDYTIQHDNTTMPQN